MDNQHFLKSSQVRDNMVSVIIPVYNSAAFISKTVESVLQQTYSNYQIVIVNDGSTDNTVDVIAKKFGNNLNIKVITTPNGGVSKARNIGIEYAEGEYLCFLDSDDKLEPTFLETLVEKINQNKVDVQLCGYYKHYANTVEKLPKSNDCQRILSQYLLGDMSFHIGSMLISKSFLDKTNIRFNSNLRLAEDILFICQVLSMAKLNICLSYLYHHQYRDGSLTTSVWTKENYFHDIYAKEVIEKEIKQIYTGEDQDFVYYLLESNVFSSKLRYGWKLFLAKKYSELASLNSQQFFAGHDVSLLPKKYRKRAKIIALNNVVIWTLIRVLYTKKDAKL
ncbi:MAG: glycosyltransferase family 2 protein [Providencia rustigianii]|uniref:glycosyltransferase family 2 protein n=1 Tax=Providencia rustigianii TaxID=158850 RepID=UPI003F2E6C87